MSRSDIKKGMILQSLAENIKKDVEQREEPRYTTHSNNKERDTQMKTITKQELIDRVNGIKGTTFVSLDIESTPRMRKTGNPYLDATKAVTLSGAINFDYEHSNNLQLQREGKEADFKAQKRSWGEHVGNWIEHKGNHYLQVKVENASAPVFTQHGESIDKEDIKPFLYESKKPHTQENLDTEIIVRDVKLDSIKVIRAFGDEFELV
jgi:hypothetical protein